MPGPRPRKDLPDNVTYDAARSSLPGVLVRALALVGIPSPKRRELRRGPRPDVYREGRPDQP